MVEMQKAGQPTYRHPDEWQQDLNPNPAAGQNRGVEGVAPEKDAPTAYDIREVHRYLQDYSDNELQQIKVLAKGIRLQQGATYIDLKDPERKEFTAMGHMEADDEHWYVPKTEVGYLLWNRLTGVKNPERLGEGNES